MVSAFGLVRDEAPGRVTGAVFMGQGEPLHNYDAVLQAARRAGGPVRRADPRRGDQPLDGRAWCRRMRRFAREGHPFRLITSLTSAIDERRAELLPAAARWPLAEVAAALGELHAATGDRVTVAWVVLGGVNTGPDEVEALGRAHAGRAVPAQPHRRQRPAARRLRAGLGRGAGGRSGTACGRWGCPWCGGTRAAPQPTPRAGCSRHSALAGRRRSDLSQVVRQGAAPSSEARSDPAESLPSQRRSGIPAAAFVHVAAVECSLPRCSGPGGL